MTTTKIVEEKVIDDIVENLSYINHCFMSLTNSKENMRELLIEEMKNEGWDYGDQTTDEEIYQISEEDKEFQFYEAPIFEANLRLEKIRKNLQVKFGSQGEIVKTKEDIIKHIKASENIMIELYSVDTIDLDLLIEDLEKLGNDKVKELNNLSNQINDLIQKLNVMNASLETSFNIDDEDEDDE